MHYIANFKVGIELFAVIKIFMKFIYFLASGIKMRLERLSEIVRLLEQLFKISIIAIK